MYSTINDSDWAAFVISENIPNIISARKKYLESPTEENKQKYIETLEKLYEDHYYQRSNGVYSAPAYLPDGILDSREAAHLTAKFQQKNSKGTGIRARTVDSVYQELVANIDARLPKVPTSQMAGGSWSQQSGSDIASEIFNRVLESFTSQRFGSPRPAEDKSRAKILTNKLLRQMALDPKAMYVAIKNNDTGDVIRAFANPRGTAVSPKIKASPEELKMASESIAKLRETTNVDQPLTLSLLATSSILPTNERFRGHDSSTMGYAFAGGGAHIYIDRVSSTGKEKELQMKLDGPDGWWSTDVASVRDAYMHVGIHELAHTIMYKYWGNDTMRNNGISSLESDYRKFGVTNNISRYGRKSASEHFAESYARYVLTGDATPEFLALLESKGLLKSQKRG